MALIIIVNLRGVREASLVFAIPTYVFIGSVGFMIVTGLARTFLGDAPIASSAEFAVQAIPGADGAGLTLLEAGRGNTLVATAPFVSEIDAVQYGIGQGPASLRPPRPGRSCPGRSARSRWA